MTAPPSLLRRFFNSWATRSLAVGAFATVIDVCVLLVALGIFRGLDKACESGCSWHNPVAAMVGVTIGSTFTFFANRHFAFRDHTPKLAPQAVKFVLSTSVCMLVHAGIVWLFTNHWKLPVNSMVQVFGASPFAAAEEQRLQVVVSKFIADLLVFSGGQLLVLRYLVFPKRKTPPPPSPPAIGHEEGSSTLYSPSPPAALGRDDEPSYSGAP